VILLVRLASRRLHTLPLPAWIAIGLVAGLVLLPWAIRLYGGYWDAVLGRPGAFLEFVMPRVG
jgi:hypothetical protein